MYICICKAITQKQLEEKMLQNGGNVKMTLKALGVGSECGTCVEDAAMEIKNQMSKTNSATQGSHSLKNHL